MISVIIPVYNQAKSLAKTLISIEGQTYKDVEIIVVDDGNTPPLAEKLQITNYKLQIQIYRLDVNGGANKARNYGFQNSQGKYIIFWDADIIARPNMLETMLNTLKAHPDASYAYSSYDFGWKAFKIWPFDAERLKKMPYIHTTSLIRREHFPGFDENIKRLQDWDLWLTMLEHDHTGVFIPKFLFNVKSGGAMSSWLPKYAYRKPFKYLLPKSLRQKVSDYDAAAETIKTKHKLV